MILLDTNLVVDAQNPSSPFYASSQQIIRDALSGDGVGINVVIFAELCAGRPEAIDDLKAELEDALIGLCDLPSEAAPICGGPTRATVRRGEDLAADGPQVSPCRIFLLVPTPS